MATELLTFTVPAATAGAVLGSAAGYFARNLFKARNGNSHMTKADHKAMCEPVQKRLDAGDEKFTALDNKIATNHNQVIGMLFEIKGKL